MARGTYIHRVRFDNPGQPIPDGDGGYTIGYAPIAPLWYAAIRPATVRDFEFAAAGTISGNATHIIEADFHPGVSIKSRVVKLDDGQIFEVAGVANYDERDVSMSLYCTSTGAIDVQ
jgi:head-tail adaptor